jgi:hypothetical protein
MLAPLCGLTQDSIACGGGLCDAPQGHVPSSWLNSSAWHATLTTWHMADSSATLVSTGPWMLGALQRLNISRTAVSGALGDALACNQLISADVSSTGVSGDLSALPWGASLPFLEELHMSNNGNITGSLSGGRGCMRDVHRHCVPHASRPVTCAALAHATTAQVCLQTHRHC